MSRNLQIRNLPDEIYEKLALRAESEGRSLTQQAIVELRCRFEKGPVAETRRYLLKRIGQDLEEGRGRTLSPSPEVLIREDRER